MTQSSIDLNFKSSDNSFSITSLCYTENDGKTIPVYPYVVAFTGHRDFAKPGEIEGVRGYTDDDVKKRFKDELAELANLWKRKSGGRAPLILLTGLADGTDQIVAQAALELKELNVKVIAVLPMERSIFELTIQPENRQKFLDLLSQSETVYELPLANEVRGHEEDLKNICDQTEDFRRIQYRLQAEFISLHSHIHFVFWDGVNIDSKGGGTGETVMFKLEGNTRLTSSNILTFSSIGPVVHFLLPRNNSASKSVPLSPDLNWDEIPVFYWTRDILRHLGKSQPDRSVMVEANRLKTPVAKFPDVVDVIQKIGSLNTEGIALSKENREDYEIRKNKSWDGLFGIGSSPEERVPETAQKIRDNVNKYIDPGTSVFIDHYVIADMLAIKFQNKTKNTIKRYSYAAFTFLLFSGLLGLLGGFSSAGGSTTTYRVFSWLFLIPYELALVIAVWIFFRSWLKKYHYKYHYYRSIAEAFRIQIFWRLALMSGCVSGFYRSHQIYKTEWLRAAINSLDVLIPSPQNESYESCQDRINFVKKMWIEEQQEFFTNRIIQKRKVSWIRFITKPSIMIFVTVLLLAFAPFFDCFQKYVFNWCNGSAVKLSLVAFIHVLIVLATSFYVSYSIKAQEPMKKEEANRYEREIFPFDRAALLLAKITSNNAAEEIRIKQEILRQLGEESLAGNSDWLLSVDKRSLTLRNVKLD